MAGSASYKPLELNKLIESVVLNQMDDQYPVSAVWEQYGQVSNAEQGTMTINEWYERFNTKVQVAESGVYVCQAQDFRLLCGA